MTTLDHSLGKNKITSIQWRDVDTREQMQTEQKQFDPPGIASGGHTQKKKVKKKKVWAPAQYLRCPTVALLFSRHSLRADVGGLRMRLRGSSVSGVHTRARAPITRGPTHRAAWRSWWLFRAHTAAILRRWSWSCPGGRPNKQPLLAIRRHRWSASRPSVGRQCGPDEERGGGAVRGGGVQTAMCLQRHLEGKEGNCRQEKQLRLWIALLTAGFEGALHTSAMWWVAPQHLGLSKL